MSKVKKGSEDKGMMRIKKGTVVEVFSNAEVPNGSWRGARIISGNGHKYDVGYVSYVDSTGVAVMDRVSRKALRPSPPRVDLGHDWESGDIIEVFHNMSWKSAIVSKVMSGNYFLVRLPGSTYDFEAHRCDMRVQQKWQDGQWVIVGKGSGISEDRESNKLSTSRCCLKLSSQVPETDEKMEECVGDNFFKFENVIDLQELHMIPLKRAAACNSPVEESSEARQKRRKFEKHDALQLMVSSCPSSSPFGKKVDIEANYDTCLDSSDAHCSSPSVGSCSSTSDIPLRLSHHSLTNLCQETEGVCSDAESFCGRAYQTKDPLSFEEELAGELHRMELYAYRRTLEALFASGPLSWDQEALVTNLRLSLHVSNDEHLTEAMLVACTTCFTRFKDDFEAYIPQYKQWGNICFLAFPSINFICGELMVSLISSLSWFILLQAYGKAR